MNDEAKYEELDKSITSVIGSGEFASTGDEEVDALARLASSLRGLGRPQFRAGLRAELLSPPTNDAGRPFAERMMNLIGALAVTSWFRGQRPFLAAGSSCGLVAGACCISGFAANVLGLAGAATVMASIHNTIPYFVALSIAAMLGWLWWLLREQGITPVTVASTLRRHGLALGSSYAAVFGASVALSMAAGLH